MASTYPKTDDVSFPGHLYDGHSSRAQAVQVRCIDGIVHVEGGVQAMRWPLGEVRLDQRLGRTARRMVLPDGASVELADSPLIDATFGTPRGSWVDRIESRWSLTMGALVSTIAICAAAYLWGLPLAARGIAAIVPPAWTSALSDTTLITLDKTVFSPSVLPLARQQQIEREFAALRPPPGTTRPGYRLFFRKGGGIGANAFALPSGDIVVTDELVALAKIDNELLGVLAHEQGHLERRHGMRQLIQGGIVSVVAAVWFGDVSALAGLSAALLNTHYSRDFEREADEYGADMLIANKVDPRALGTILTRLEAEHNEQEEEKKKDAGTPTDAYFSTHPITSERIAYLERRAAEQAGPHK